MSPGSSAVDELCQHWEFIIDLRKELRHAVEWAHKRADTGSARDFVLVERANRNRRRLRDLDRVLLRYTKDQRNPPVEVTLLKWDRRWGAVDICERAIISVYELLKCFKGRWPERKGDLDALLRQNTETAATYEKACLRCWCARDLDTRESIATPSAGLDDWRQTFDKTILKSNPTPGKGQCRPRASANRRTGRTGKKAIAMDVVARLLGVSLEALRSRLGRAKKGVRSQPREG